jgi:D-alanyl-D-alanine carboxypeptidase
VIINSLKVVDTQLSTTTPNGTFWHRYNFDGYGETAKGAPWGVNPAGSFITHGRLWVIFAGERGEYDLAGDNLFGAESHLVAMSRTANDGDLMPEQIWDSQPPAGQLGFASGTGTTSATPLAWTHAQYIRLAFDIAAGRLLEQPAIVARRYLQMLVEQQRISLYDKISRWFPNLLAADQVTVEMLVANTAGYIDYVTVDDFQRLQLAEPFRTFTDDELINYSVRNGKMNFLPGTSQQYSHTDNVLLGQVIQRATKQSIKELYDENIFGPMGMKDTQFPVNQDIQSKVLHAFTLERKIYEDCTYWNPFWGSTPALPTSNLHDLGKWGPILGTGRLISPAHFQAQIAPTSVGKGKNKPDPYFAYGVVFSNGWIVQNPNINGFSGGFGYNLSNGVTIVVEATNSETATTDGSAFDILREVIKYVTPATPLNF